jgi:hypothetical protein
MEKNQISVESMYIEIVKGRWKPLIFKESDVNLFFSESDISASMQAFVIVYSRYMNLIGLKVCFGFTNSTKVFYQLRHNLHLPFRDHFRTTGAGSRQEPSRTSDLVR